MLGARIGVICGLIFEVILIWQGIGAAGLVLLFALLDALIGVGVWLWWEIINGHVDTEAIRKLVGTIFSDKSDQQTGRQLRNPACSPFSLGSSALSKEAV